MPELVSTSPTFYKQIFCTKVFWSAFMNLQFGFVIFWGKDIGKKGACKMLVKLTTCVFLRSSASVSVLPITMFMQYVCVCERESDRERMSVCER